ncbi:MAG: DUF2318 domain-containing protein [Ruminococcus sp.]|nr:DUF2318 domain-containing protein [Ruminococcus sp.]
MKNHKFTKAAASAAMSALLISSALMFTACSDKSANSDIKAETVKVSSGENLKIKIADVTDTAKFYPVDIDGTEIEVIAIKDSSGEIRTAFNTCQICYSSGRGYYEQEGDYLVCQNCGNSFSADQVEVQSGGCNPVPIFSENKTVTDDTIEISYDCLNEAKQIFANWKTNF